MTVFLQAAAFGSSDGGKTSLAGGAVVRKTNTPLFLLNNFLSFLRENDDDLPRQARDKRNGKVVTQKGRPLSLVRCGSGTRSTPRPASGTADSSSPSTSLRAPRRSTGRMTSSGSSQEPRSGTRTRVFGSAQRSARCSTASRWDGQNAENAFVSMHFSCSIQ